jgi:hypothetical protein
MQFWVRDNPWRYDNLDDDNDDNDNDDNDNALSTDR